MDRPHTVSVSHTQASLIFDFIKMKVREIKVFAVTVAPRLQLMSYFYKIRVIPMIEKYKEKKWYE